MWNLTYQSFATQVLGSDSPSSLVNLSITVNKVWLAILIIAPSLMRRSKLQQHYLLGSINGFHLSAPSSLYNICLGGTRGDVSKTLRRKSNCLKCVNTFAAHCSSYALIALKRLFITINLCKYREKGKERGKAVYRMRMSSFSVQYDFHNK